MLDMQQLLNNQEKLIEGRFCNHLFFENGGRNKVVIKIESEW
jgi:hypothetical protein